ncbi:MAG: hypothetical protein WCW67_01070 [Candidatus Margulisiibacteriota bacterium]|jgi:hypothetical protein
MEKKLYYYLLSLAALFFLLWGVVDLANTIVTSFGRAPLPADQASEGLNEQNLDLYYQKKMLVDRYSDSLIRIVVSGLAFYFAKKTIKDMEKA